MGGDTKKDGPGKRLIIQIKKTSKITSLWGWQRSFGQKGFQVVDFTKRTGQIRPNRLKKQT